MRRFQVLAAAGMLIFAIACASSPPSSAAAPSATAHGTIARVYYWRAKPGKLAEYTDYITRIAEPIDHEAQRRGSVPLRDDILLRATRRRRGRTCAYLSSAIPHSWRASQRRSTQPVSRWSRIARSAASEVSTGRRFVIRWAAGRTRSCRRLWAWYDGMV
jgi:hypothetical protein